MLVRRALLTGAALVLGSGCGGEEGEWDRLFRRAQEVRELTLFHDVPVDEKTSEEYTAEQAANAEEIDEADLQEYRDTYGRLGYFGPDTDLRADISGSSSDWVAGFYSPREKGITVVGDPSESVLVHEIVHALQDQHFTLMGYRHAVTTDEHMARRAIVEGDATLAQTRFVLAEKHQVDLDDLDWPGFFTGWADISAATLEDSTYPVIFRAGPAFLYPYGAPYCAHHLTGASPTSMDDTRPFPFDWSGQRDLFFDQAPTTTEQVMKYDAVDPTVPVGLEDVPEGLAQVLPGMYWDTLGAWYSYLLFHPLDGVTGAGDVKELAGRWDGDRVLFVRDAGTGEVGVIWASAWDDEASATRVETALRALHGFTPPSGGDPRMGTAEDGEGLWIEHRGALALMIKNVDPAHVPTLADAALAGETAPRVLRPLTRPSLPVRIDEHRKHG